MQTVAQTGQGVDEVVEKIDKHREFLESSGELERRRVRRARDEIEAIAVTALRRKWGNVHERTELDDLAEKVVAGDTDPYSAADSLLESYTEEESLTCRCGRASQARTRSEHHRLCPGPGTCSFARSRFTCVRTVPSLMNRLAPTSALLSPFAMAARTSRSRSVSAESRFRLTGRACANYVDQGAG